MDDTTRKRQAHLAAQVELLKLATDARAILFEGCAWSTEEMEAANATITAVQRGIAHTRDLLDLAHRSPE